MVINSENLKDYLINIDFKDDGTITGDYISTNGKTIQIKIVFPKHFPTVLPKIFVGNSDELNLFIPHLEQNGLICYTTSNNVLFDSNSPEIVIRAALKKAIDTLENGIQKLNNDDFRKEFIAFWDQQKNSMPINFFATADDVIKPLELFSADNNLIVNDVNPSYSETVKRFFSQKLEKLNAIDTLYVPLRLKNKIMPPNPKKSWSKKDLLNIVRKNCTQSNKRYFEKWITRKGHNAKILFLKIPISEQNEILIGFLIKKSKQSFKKYTGPVIPLIVQRFDLKYLLERTSGEHKFTNFNVCIVGLGSVGSKLSVELANLGINQMTLIDPEKFEKDNIFRHALGADSIRNGKTKFKVDELQLELERKSPYLEVSTEAMNILDIVQTYPNYFDKFDYSFICIGDTMPSLELNKIFSENKHKVFYTWVEPLGLGGHVLYIDYEKKGCFNCLNTNPITGEVISNRSSLIKPGQHIEKNLASCRSAFIPYGSLTSSEAAIKTVGLFHKVVYKRVTKNSILTWLGNTDDFIEMGYEFSDRFLSNNALFPTIESNFTNDRCKICGENS